MCSCFVLQSLAGVVEKKKDDMHKFTEHNINSVVYI